MRSYQIPRELTYDSFIETYGPLPSVLSTEDKQSDSKMTSKHRSMFVRPKEVASILKNGHQRGRSLENVRATIADSSDTNNNAIQQQDTANRVNTAAPKDLREDKMSGPAYRKLRKISLKKKDSKSSADAKATPSLKRSQSVNFLAKSSARRNNWLSSFSPSFYRRTGRKSPTSDVNQVPMSKMNTAAHRGFLSKKNIKKQTWERFWCILQDSCLYCYASPNFEFADDVISFGGYFVIAKFGNTDTAGTILLERPGKESYLLRGDSVKEHRSWVEALRNNIDSGKRKSTKITRSASTANCVASRKMSVAALPKCTSEGQMDVTEIKAKLLQEVLDQQQEILREQKMLERMTLSRQRSVANSPVVIQKSKKTASVTSLTHSEDNGYCSSFDGSMHDTYSEGDYSKHDQSSSSVRSCRSMSTVSVISTSSLGSIAEEGRKTTVCPKVLAEIEEFQAFSKRTKERRGSQEF